MPKVMIKLDFGGFYPFDVSLKESISKDRRFPNQEQAIQWVSERYPCEIVE